MSDQFARVKTLPNICGIMFAFSGQMLPSTIEGYQTFYNSMPSGIEFQNVYFSRASVNFDEDGDISKAGPFFKQKLSIRFPASDNSRAERIALMFKVKYIKIMLSSGKHIIIGRNDFEQNARFRVKTKVDERLGQVEFEASSIMPSGYTPSVDAGGLPTLFPIDFINED